MIQIEINQTTRLLQRDIQNNVRFDIVFFSNGLEKSRDTMKFQLQEQEAGNGWKDVDVAGLSPESREKIVKTVSKYYNDCFGLVETITNDDHGLFMLFRIENFAFKGFELFFPDEVQFNEQMKIVITGIHSSPQDHMDLEDDSQLIIDHHRRNDEIMAAGSYFLSFRFMKRDTHFHDEWVVVLPDFNLQVDLAMVADSYMNAMLARKGTPFSDRTVPMHDDYRLRAFDIRFRDCRPRR